VSTVVGSSRFRGVAPVAAFNARLRQTVDLETVRHDLVGVTHDAFQPAHIGLWLAPGPGESEARSSGLSGGQRAAGGMSKPRIDTS